ncbi:MAG: hypothetical protein CL878_15230 [Dehalococcoidia bacterium]|nr:hypothetical protein [Dehalococcoidia bacterium]
MADLLATAGQLEVVVTSRLPLQIPGEKAYAVPPLALPDPQQLPSLAMLSQAEAVALFIHRAQAVQPDFVVTEENAPAVAGLCAQVEGLPLALELAAARTRLLTPEAILQQLRQLRQEGQDIPVREQTLRAVIGWSYGLLPEPEQCLFRRLAVFVGGSTPEAAETVCGSALDLDMPDGVKTLVAASLVRQEAMADGKPRLLLPETIREYGQDQLTASEEAPEVERKHVAHYLDLAETAEPELHEEQQLVWLDRLEQEHDNLRAALRCAVEVEDAEMALRLCGALAWFWWIHGHLSEGRAWLAQALEVPAAQVKTAARAKALAASGFLARLQGDMAAARPHAEAGLAIYREVDDLRGRADALRTAGMALAVTGDLSKARELVAESLTLWRQEEDAHGIAHSLLSLGLVSQATGDDATAQACWEESVHFSRQLGDRFCLGVTLRELGRNAQARGDGRTAQELLAESLGLAREVGHEQGIAYARCGLADIVAAQGDYAEAGSLLQESLAAFRELADQAGIGRALEGFATLAALQHQPERALRLAGAATALHQTYEIAVPIPFQTTVERWLAPARQELSEADADAAWAEGRALSTERAFEYALSPVVEAASDAAS